MLGIYDYTVWLTYLSVGVSVVGIVVGLSGNGHPWIASICLLACAILDGFDGRVARTKKDRTPEAIQFGIELDSLADVIAFGVLPCAVCAAADRALAPPMARHVWWALFYVVCALFVLAGVIRLAVFNSAAASGPKQYYSGVPITTSAFVFPQVVVVQFSFRGEISFLPLSMALMLLMGVLFLLRRVRIKKPSLKMVIICAVLGLMEIALLTVMFFVRLRHA